MLNVEAGDEVSRANGFMGNISEATRLATVLGNGSTWINSGNLYVSYVSPALDASQSGPFSSATPQGTNKTATSTLT